MERLGELARTVLDNAGMDRNLEFRTRMYRFAVRLVRFCRGLPPTRETDVLVRQLLRSGTGMPANYRAAGKARSYADFVSKIAVAAEEGDETVFWLDLAIDTALTTGVEAQELRTEARELAAICSASHATAKSRHAARKRG